MLFQLKFDDEIFAKLQQPGRDNEAQSTRDGSKDVCRSRKTEGCLVKRGLLNPGRQRNQRTRSQHCRRGQKHDEQQRETSLHRKKVVTAVHQGDVLSGMSDTPGNTRGVLRVIQNANTSTTDNDGVNPSEGFSKTSELSGIITARGGTSKRRMAKVARDRATPYSNTIVRETAAILQPEESPAGRVNPCHPCGAAGRHHGKTLLRLGQSKACRPELISTKVQAHRQESVGPRRTLGSHHLYYTIHELFKNNGHLHGYFFAD